MSLEEKEIEAETGQTVGICITTAFVVLICAITYSCEMSRQHDSTFTAECLKAGKTPSLQTGLVGAPWECK